MGGSIYQRNLVKNWIITQANNNSKIIILATRLLWLHIIRLLSQDNPLPKINQTYLLTFFRHCSAPSIPKVDVDLQATVNLLGWGGLAKPQWNLQICKYLANEYLVNLKNHAKFNYWQYTLKFLKWKVEILNIDKKIKKKLLGSIYAIMKHVYSNQPYDINTFSEDIRQYVEQFTTCLQQLVSRSRENHPDFYLEKITFFYLLKRETNDTLDIKIIPQSSFTRKHITIDKKVGEELLKVINLYQKDLSKQQQFSILFNYKPPPDYQVKIYKTDGVSVSITLEKQSTMDVCEESIINNNIIGIIQQLTTENNTNVFQPMDVDEPVRIIGVDLGRKDVFMLINHPEKNQCTVQYWSCKRWQFESGLTRCNRVIEQWKEKDHDISNLEEELTHFVQSSEADRSRMHWQHVYDNIRVIENFYFRQRHYRLRFWMYNRRQQALHKMCRYIGDRTDIIAIGNPEFSSVSRGYAPTPAKTTVRKLQQLFPNKVKLIDEYNTSKLCSNCYLPLKFTKMKMPGGGPNYRVQRCNRCSMYWNRDVNAARNMRALFVYEQENHNQRMLQFERPN